MYLKLCLAFAICIYGVSCMSYEDAVTKCKSDYQITKDEPLDYFLAHGTFQPGQENIKCFFSCVVHCTGIGDEKGAPIAEKLSALAKTSNSPDLQLFADEGVMKACLPPSEMSNPCDAALNFMTCAIKQKAAAEKAKTK